MEFEGDKGLKDAVPKVSKIEVLKQGESGESMNKVDSAYLRMVYYKHSEPRLNRVMLSNLATRPFSRWTRRYEESSKFTIVAINSGDDEA